MTFPIVIETKNGRVTAALMWDRTIRQTADTRDEAIHSIQEQLERRVSAGELVWLEVSASPLGMFGTFRDDPTLQDICDEAYRLRDAEREALPQQ